MQGVTAFVAFYGTGLLHSMYANPNEILDVVFADLVVNIHLLSIARVGLMNQKPEQPEVVLICAHPYDPFPLKNRYEYITTAEKKHPFSKCFGSYNIKMVPCYYHFVLRFLVYQVVPSLILDIFLKAFKLPAIAMSSQRKIFVGSKDLEHFLHRSYKSDGVSNLAELVVMSKESDFKIDSLFQQTTEVNIQNSYDSFVSGTRKYLLRDDESSLPAARKRYRMWVF